MKVMCMPCDLEFPNNSAYKEHKAAVHQGYAPDHGQGSSTQGAVLPPGVTPDMLPSTDFLDTVKRIETGGTTDTPPLIVDAPSKIENNPVVTTLPKNIPGMVDTPLGPVPSEMAGATSVTRGTKEVPDPLQLIYMYKGDCPTHFTPVDTLMIDNEGKLFALAYCSKCKTNVEQKKVVKL